MMEGRSFVSDRSKQIADAQERKQKKKEKLQQRKRRRLEKDYYYRQDAIRKELEKQQVESEGGEGENEDGESEVKKVEEKVGEELGEIDLSIPYAPSLRLRLAVWFVWLARRWIGLVFRNSVRFFKFVFSMYFVIAIVAVIAILMVLPPLKTAQSAEDPLGFYASLEIPVDASHDQIHKAFRRMTKKWHPDRFSRKSVEEKEEASTKYSLMTRARDTLMDSKKRANYDQFGHPNGPQGFLYKLPLMHLWKGRSGVRGV
jgi:hypothetical protein